MISSRALWIVIGLFSFSSLAFAEGFVVPPPQQRVAIFKALAAEMQRLDGAALAIRASSRPQSWESVLARLELEAASASTSWAFARAFARLDLAYPNLHSFIGLPDSLMSEIPKRVRPKIRFDAEWVALDQPIEYAIAVVQKDVQLPESEMPAAGDRVTAINGKPIAHWRDESVTFCKFALRGQCEFEMRSALYSELLDWTRHEKLSYTLERGSRSWTVEVPVGARPSNTFDPKVIECGSNPKRYPGFKLAYQGNRACVFQSETDPGTALLRITSFQYRQLSDDQKIRSLGKEVETMLPWWLEHAGAWRHLVIDLIDNGGGNAPTPYYKLLLSKPFQEQYVQFRKGPELEDEKLRMADNGLFWGTKGQEIWFQKLRASEIWQRLPLGAFTPSVPQFCADEEKDCSEGLVAPYEHPFHGRVSVMLNQFCISSCDGFAWQMQDKLGARSFGHPNAADPAYSRLTINVLREESAPEGFRLEVRPIRDEVPANLILSQTVYVTRSTDENGALIDGVPVTLTGFVPYTNENADRWVEEVLKAALRE